MSIAVVGSLNMDLVVKVEYLPGEGETVPAFGRSEAPGGKGANQAAAAARLGAAVSMIGKVGRDPHGDRLLAELAAAGADVSAVMTSPSPTGTALITVDRFGRNQIVVVSGANGDLSPADIWCQRDVIGGAELVLLQMEVPADTVAYTLALAKNMGKTTILKPAPASELGEDILRRVDFLIPNERELRIVAGIGRLDGASIKAAAAAFAKRGVRHLIVTLGDKGCCHSDGELLEYYDAYAVQAVDMTAAGDSFIGGFAAGYAETRDIAAAIRYGMRAAAITVTRPGAMSALPTRDEVLAFPASE